MKDAGSPSDSTSPRRRATHSARNGSHLQRQLSILEEITRAIAAQSSRSDLFELLGARLEQLFGFEGLQILLQEEHSSLLTSAYFRCQGRNLAQQTLPAAPALLQPILSSGQARSIASDFQLVYPTPGETANLFAGAPALPKSWLGVPLYIEQQVAGVVCGMNFQLEDAFRSAEIELLKILALHLGIALQNLRLYEVETERRLIAETLEEVAVAINYSLDLNETLELILGQLGRVVPYDSASIMLWEGEELMVAAQCGFRSAAQFNARPRLEENPNIDEVVRQRHALLISDTRQDARWQSFLAGNDSYIRCWIGVPLIVQSQVIGVLNVDSAAAEFYSEHDVALASAFAGQASIAIQNARLYAESQQQAQELGALRQATLSLTRSLESPVVIDSILVSAMSLLGRITELHVFRYENERLIVGTVRWPENAQSYPTAEPRKKGLSYTVARSGETIVVEDMDHHPLYVDDKRGLKGACIGLPLKIGPRVVGVMIVSYPEPRRFPLSELRMLHLFADHAAVALENSSLYEQGQAEIIRRKASEDALRQANLRLEDQLHQIEILQEQLREQAIRDPLTSLYNRRYLNETLEREFDLALRRGQPIGIIMIDLDHFKSVNDRFGHKNGDYTLQALGQLIQSKVRRSDIPCRYGGEEFCIVLPGATREITQHRAEGLRRRFAELSPVAGQPELKVTLSIGVALYPDHGKTPEEVLERADQALYVAKARGRNCVAIWGEAGKEELGVTS